MSLVPPVEARLFLLACVPLLLVVVARAVSFGRRAPRDRSRLGVGAASFAPGVFLAGWYVLSLPLAKGPWVDSEPVFEIVIAPGFCALVLSAMFVAVGWTFWRRVRGRGPARRAIVALTAITVVGSCVLVAAGARRAASRGVSPENYLGSLPVVADLALPEGVGLTQHAALGERVLLRSCLEGPTHFYCLLCLAEPGASACGPEIGILRDVPGGTRGGPVRYDARHRILVSEAFSDTVAPIDDRRIVWPPGLYVTDIAESLHAPWSWLLAAGLALVLALIELALALRLRALRRALQHARAGFVEEDGDVSFDDGELPARGRPAAPVPPGPALALATAPHASVGYRDDGTRGAWRVFPGDRTTAIADLDNRVLGHRTFALAFAAVTAAPLLAAATVGILG